MPGRLQDPHYINMPYRDVMDYHPPPHEVSNFRIIILGLLLTNITREIA